MLLSSSKCSRFKIFKSKSTLQKNEELRMTSWSSTPCQRPRRTTGTARRATPATRLARTAARSRGATRIARTADRLRGATRLARTGPRCRDNNLISQVQVKVKTTDLQGNTTTKEATEAKVATEAEAAEATAEELDNN